MFPHRLEAYYDALKVNSVYASILNSVKFLMLLSIPFRLEESSQPKNQNKEYSWRGVVDDATI
jgi:hypothetical protein